MFLEVTEATQNTSGNSPNFPHWSQPHFFNHRSHPFLSSSWTIRGISVSTCWLICCLALCSSFNLWSSLSAYWHWLGWRLRKVFKNSLTLSGVERASINSRITAFCWPGIGWELHFVVVRYPWLGLRDLHNIFSCFSSASHRPVVALKFNFTWTNVCNQRHQPPCLSFQSLVLLPLSVMLFDFPLPRAFVM